MNDIQSPHIPVEALPESERKDAEFLQMLILNLDAFRTQVTYALDIYETAFNQRQALLSEAKSADPRLAPKILSQIRRPIGWQFVASRDAAMMIYHFKTVLKAINDNLRHCPTVLSQTDRRKLGEAMSLFDKSFPTYARMRKGVAHIPEHYRNRAARDRNTYRSVGSNRFISNSLSGRNYVMTREVTPGHVEILSLEMDEKLPKKLFSVVVVAYSAFDNMEKKIRDAAQNDQGETPK